MDTPRPSPRTNRTRRVPHPVLIGHAASERACSAHRRRACRRQFLGEGDEDEDDAGGGAAARGVQERRWWAMDPERLLYMKTDLEEATDAVLFYVEVRRVRLVRKEGRDVSG